MLSEYPIFPYESFYHTELCPFTYVKALLDYSLLPEGNGCIHLLRNSVISNTA